MNILKFVNIKFILINATLITLITLISVITFVPLVTSQIQNITDSSSASSTCENQLSPTSFNDCNKYSDENFYCCFLTPARGADLSLSNACYNLENYQYFGQRTINNYQVAYNINCGVGSENAYNGGGKQNKCGESNPTKGTDCFKYSISLNSCCYYNYEGTNGCFWLGAKYFGSTVLNNMELSCQGNNLSKNRFLIINIISLFIYLLI